MATLTKTNGGVKPMTSPLTEFYLEPLTAFTNMRRMMDSFFDTMTLPQAAFGPLAAQPPQTNVYEKDGSYVVECAVPGYTKDGITVEARGNELTISGTCAEDKAEEQKQYRRREIRQGTFSRTIAFPQEIDHDKVVAALENGMLKVIVRAVQPVPSKKIPITAT